MPNYASSNNYPKLCMLLKCQCDNSRPWARKCRLKLLLLSLTISSCFLLHIVWQFDYVACYNSLSLAKHCTGFVPKRIFFPGFISNALHLLNRYSGKGRGLHRVSPALVFPCFSSSIWQLLACRSVTFCTYERSIRDEAPGPGIADLSWSGRVSEVARVLNQRETTVASWPSD